ncbi:MAG: hypothetical protein LBJ59_03850 [Zoogloeaceae bacterium]|jgi:hypothetical protein|nr:hypothetical protein [Zoogloeaceae bacterium]
MKKRKNRRKNAQALLSLSGMANDFTRGFVSYAAVAAVAGRVDERGFPIIDARLLRQSTLAGAALVVGVAAGKAAGQGDWLAAALATAGSIAGVYGLHRLLELSHGKGI